MHPSDAAPAPAGSHLASPSPRRGDNPLRILYVRALYWPEDFGGNRYASEVTTRLARRGHTVDVVTGQPRGQHRPDHNEGVAIHYFPVTRSAPLLTHLSHSLWPTPWLRSSIARLSPDVILLASYELAVALYGTGRPRAPSVFMYHSSFYSESAQRLAKGGLWRRAAFAAVKRYSRAIERLALGNAQRIIAVSDFSRAEIAERLPAAVERTTVIPTGVDTSFFAPPSGAGREEARRALGIRPGQRVACVVGRLSGVKRYDRAVAAVAALHRGGLDLVLLVVGDGQERTALEAQASSLGIAGQVRFLGFQTGEPHRRALHAADVQICCSEFENLSLALLEGLACGLPVVALPTGGTVSLISAIDARLLCDRIDEDSLAAKLRQVLADEAWRQGVGERGRAHVVAQHGWDRIVDQVEQVVGGVVSSSPHGR